MKSRFVYRCSDLGYGDVELILYFTYLSESSWGRAYALSGKG